VQAAVATEDRSVALTKQLSIMLENRPGALAELCSKLAEKAINILGLMVPDQPGVAPVRFVVNSVEAAKKTLESLGLKFSEEEVLLVHLSDRPGALGKLTRKLADRGIDVKYAYGTILRGAGRAAVVLAVSDLTAAEKIAK
jgi:hypothetical protein